MIDDIDTSDTEGSTDEYTVHNPMTEWNLMRPIEKERYESLEQLKFALTNYAVANGYPLRFAKSDSQKLRVKCGKLKDDKTCPFYLYATRIGSEQSFQIKKIVGKHTCDRSNDFGSIVTPNWIAQHYMKEFIARPKIKLKELKADLEKKFHCSNISITRCYRAKKRAQALIEKKMSCTWEITSYTMPLPLNEREMTPPRPSVKRTRRVSEKDDMYRTTRAVTCKNCLEKGHNIRSCLNAKRLLPQKEKKKENDDKYTSTRVVTCKNCLEKGHNIRSCKNRKRLSPLKEKKKEKDDKYPTTRAITCKNCLEKGHNIRSCQNVKRLLPPKEKEKKKVGRPRIADQGGAYRITRRSTRGGTSRTMEEENLKKHVEAMKELHMEETMEVPMSMNTAVDEAEDDDESIDETQATIDDLRKSGYTEDEIDAIHADEAQDDDDDDDDDDDEEVIEEITQSAAIKGRRSSERILKIKLKKKINGRGSTLGTPIDIE